MIKKKIKTIIRILEELFPAPPIPLTHSDPFTLLIAVVLSARCTDKCVNEVTPALFKRADTPQKMVKVSVEEIQKLIKRCGLSPQKALGIHQLSELIIEKHGGQIPRTMEELIELPRVGRKTASVVLAQAFDTPAFPVDTHIFRLAKRWGLSEGKNEKRVEEDLKLAFPKSLWIKLHLQMIYYGRAYCPARGHRVEKCPICSYLALGAFR